MADRLAICEDCNYAFCCVQERLAWRTIAVLPRRRSSIAGYIHLPAQHVMPFVRNAASTQPPD
ncbi:hypothetical protein BDW75DRAFT_217839 [Aspergillus navahoensis]